MSIAEALMQDTWRNTTLEYKKQTKVIIDYLYIII